MSQYAPSRKVDRRRRIRGIADDGDVTGDAAGCRRRKGDVQRHDLSRRDDLPVGDAGGGEAGSGNRDTGNSDIDAAGIREVHAQDTADDHIAEAQARRVGGESTWSRSIY